MDEEELARKLEALELENAEISGDDDDEDDEDEGSDGGDAADENGDKEWWAGIYYLYFIHNKIKMSNSVSNSIYRWNKT